MMTVERYLQHAADVEENICWSWDNYDDNEESHDGIVDANFAEGNSANGNSGVSLVMMLWLLYCLVILRDNKWDRKR